MKNVMLELTRITQQAALVQKPDEQVQIIVDSISAVLQVDVCSLYLENAREDMILMASHGLDTHKPIVIPQGRGLVGLVAKSRHTINLADPAKHPDYFYVPRAHEEQLRSFCGVPLIHKGRVLGVLVVQSRRSRKLGDEQEAFLSTLASHLALLVPGLPLDKLPQSTSNLRYDGISGASGIAVGKVRLGQSARLMDVADRQSDDPQKELEQWLDLKAAVSREIQHERDTVEKTLGENLALIIDAHQMLLADATFEARVEQEIHSGRALLPAIKHATHYFSELFRNMDDPYLKARHEDIDHLGNKLYQVWLGQNATQQQVSINHPVVLTGSNISVSDIVSLPADKLVAIVCTAGAALSHIAVFANALGIPALMGVGELKNLDEGELVIVDGNLGQLIRSPSDLVLAEYRSLQDSRRGIDRELSKLSHLPARTSDGVHIELLANSGLQADVMPGIRNGADGIGLYRTEIPFMIRQSLPSEDEQVSVYRQVFQAYAGKPVYIRTLDIGGDKPLSYMPVVEEENPALGWRGVRVTLDNLQLMMTQLRAIIRAADGKSDVKILLPMLSSTSELDQCIALLDDACEQLEAEGKTVQRPDLGIMVEVPAVISLLPFWWQKLDFISIGSNDLSQYLLAIDRNNSLVSKLYDPLHPAVILELRHIVDLAEKYDLPVSLCGEMASDPVSVMLLIGLGLRRLSLSSSRLPLIKWMIRSISIEDAKRFCAQALLLDNAAEIRQTGLHMLSEMGIDLNNIHVEIDDEKA